ncbi:DNA-methyltransferase [Limnochorda pilosa]|uniref:Methyltransferase n=1 Tax=Limnochorda pilosa TaxID=1555112 RepID=A0A0K2SFU9_LIMPI|nr:site-specific DNA-methyltransferase [Limnochorda pilosa]BAS25912.1 SAM-dependent methyltransferase [Limnochorda pilosa]
MTERSRRSTRTSAFGVSRREGHDSSAFYARQLYVPGEGSNGTTGPSGVEEGVQGGRPAANGKPGRPRRRAQEAPGTVETALPPEAIDRIFCQDARHMTQLPDGCVHLMVTSPPYNVGKEYDQDLSLQEYLELLEAVFRETYRVLAPGGRAAVNVANLGRKPYVPLHLHVAQVMLRIGFLMRGEVIWSKAAAPGTSCAWGSWMSASNPTLRDVHEYILIFSKERFDRPRAQGAPGRESTIERNDFLELTQSIWSFNPESARRVGHPAPFPVELPRRLIELYTFKGDVVLDPFAGVGSTCVAAVQTGRRFVAYEIEDEYVRRAEARLQAFSRTGRLEAGPAGSAW